jgi:hypothetical protein
LLPASRSGLSKDYYNPRDGKRTLRNGRKAVNSITACV